MSMPEHTPKIWQTYMNWAYTLAKKFGKKPPSAECEDPNSRLSPEQDDALALILFSAFLLETRLRRYINTLYPKRFRKNWRPRSHTLGSMLPMAPFARGAHGKAPLDYPEHWNHKELLLLLKWRNWIAHGNMDTLEEEMRKQDKELPEIALEFFNTAMGAIAAIHKADGQDGEPDCLQLVLKYVPPEKR